MHKAAFIFQNKSIILWKGVQNETIFKIQRMSSIFNKMLFAEPNESNRRSSIFVFVFLECENLFYKFISLRS